MEIERKWLLKEVPTNLNLIEFRRFEQFYLSIEPEVRLRYDIGSSEPFVMTVKTDGTLSREEIETPVSAPFYGDIRKLVGRQPIQKTYFVFKCGDHELEVSIVDGDEFIYAEVEFSSEQEARSFQLPIDDAVEVTDNPDYKMKNYWKRTRLDDN